MSEPTLQTISALLHQGDLAKARLLLDNVLAREPANAGAWHLLGSVQARAGDPKSAIVSFTTAIKHASGFKEAYFDLAQLLETAGQIVTAAKVYEFWLRAEQSQPLSDAPAVAKSERQKIAQLFQAALAAEKNGELARAIAYYRQALHIDPDSPDTLLNIGNVLYRAGDYTEAQHALIRCIRARPGNGYAFNTLGTLYRNSGKPARAIAAFRQALHADHRYVAASRNLATLFHELKLVQEEKDAHEKTLALDPGDADVMCKLAHIYDELCDWPRAEVLKREIKKTLAGGMCPMQPFTINIFYDCAALQRENAVSFTARKYPAGKAYDGAFALPSLARSDCKLAIAYISADFHDHATTYLMAELLEHHDKSQFEIHAYSYGPQHDSPMRRRLLCAVDRFHDISMLDDQEAALRIRADGIDIAVDLKGYTHGNRLGILAQRPAPVQMHYLGFPGTLGAPFIDYFIADSITVPPDRRKDFTESIITLPHSYQVNDRKRPLPGKSAARGDYGLPERGFVFCDFNNPYKITPAVFSLWMKLLGEIEGSVLWLFEYHAAASENLRKEAEKAGVDPQRLVFAKKAAPAEHFTRFAVADLFIDTAPVCGHTTASDALWCGVPVIALKGESFISRVAASVLNAAGLAELVMDTFASYEARAVELARSPEKLAALRCHLQQERMQLPLFDSASATKALEAAYKKAAQHHAEKKAPHAFTIE